MSARREAARPGVNGGRPRQVWTTASGFWWGGHAQAMEEVLGLMNDLCARDAGLGEIIEAVAVLANGVRHLQEAEAYPPAWLAPIEELEADAIPAAWLDGPA